MIDVKWKPGMSTPFDPIASKLAKKLGIKCIIINGNKLINLKKFFNNENFKGTLIY